MEVHVIKTATSLLEKEFDSWKKSMKARYYGLKIHSITPHTYEDREENYSISSLIITYETYDMGD